METIKHTAVDSGGSSNSHAWFHLPQMKAGQSRGGRRAGWTAACWVTAVGDGATDSTRTVDHGARRLQDLQTGYAPDEQLLALCMRSACAGGGSAQAAQGQDGQIQGVPATDGIDCPPLSSA